MSVRGWGFFWGGGRYLRAGEGGVTLPTRTHLERHLHEVGLDEPARLRQAVAHARVVVQRAADLVRVVVDARDVRAGEEGDLAQRPAHAAPDVEDFCAALEAELEGEVVLVALDGLLVGLPREAVGKVERGAPACVVLVFWGGSGVGLSAGELRAGAGARRRGSFGMNAPYS